MIKIEEKLESYLKSLGLRTEAGFRGIFRFYRPALIPLKVQEREVFTSGPKGFNRLTIHALRDIAVVDKKTVKRLRDGEIWESALQVTGQNPLLLIEYFSNYDWNPVEESTFLIAHANVGVTYSDIPRGEQWWEVYIDFSELQKALGVATAVQFEKTASLRHSR